MFKKKRNIFLIILLLSFAVILRVYALTIDDPHKLVNVTKTGEVDHGDYEITISDLNPNNVDADQSVQKSNYIVRVVLSSDPGYYVENLTVKNNGEDLELGFIAGSEHGAFFRRYGFSPTENLYEFFIPESATEDNKVEVSIKYAKKAKVDITYQNYTGNKYDEEHVFNIDNYGEEKMLIKNYMDGDIVLPEDAVSNGSLLKLQFSEEDYELFKGDGENEIRAEAVIRNEQRNDNLLFAGKDACIDEEHSCYVVVLKEFNTLSQGTLRFGYNDIKIYVPGYVGFRAEGDVNNFNDRDLSFGFNNENLEANIDELFYGTKKLRLFKVSPRQIVNDNSTNNCGQAGDFDNVTGFGYGYNVTYNAGIATVNINSYYQDLMVLELTLTKNNQNIFDDNVKININRFAFSGELLEVDSIGRNCRENDNNNTCDKGIYYSIQYRGVLSAFYVDDDVEEENFNSIMVVDSINENDIHLSDWNQPERAYKRNKDFTPYAIALFYDQNEMIVGTKVFNLNEEIDDEGYMTKANFNSSFEGYNLNTAVNKNYIRFGNDTRIPISKLDYFNFIDNAAIMHEIVLISKDEAEENNIKKVALFLVNGEVKEDEVPSLTYGIGEGKVLQIHEEHHDDGGND